LILAGTARRRGGLSLNAARLLLAALILVPAVASLAPSASAVACDPHATGIQEADAAEYKACGAGLNAVNALCEKEFGGPCLL
jgi:hypothetical protein